MKPADDPDSAEVKRRALVGVSALVIRGLGVRAIAVLAVLVLARILGPEEFGVATFAVTGMLLMDLVANASMAAGLVRQEDEPSPAELRAVLAVQVWLAVGISSLVGASALLFDSQIARTLAITAIALPISVARSPAMVITERQLNYRPLVFADVAEAGMFSVVSIALAAAGLGPAAVALGVVSRKLTGTAILLVLVPNGRVTPKWNTALIRPVLGFGFRFQAASLIDQGRDQALNVGIAVIGSVTTLGLWTAAYRFLQLPFIFLEALWRVAFPTFSRLKATGADVGAAIERPLGMIAVLLTGALAALVSAGPDAFSLLLGEVWRPAFKVVPLAAIGLAISGPLSVMAGGYLFAEGQATRVLKVMSTGAGVWLVLGLGGLALFGIVGIGIGWLAASLTEAVLFTNALEQEVGVRSTARVAPPVLCGVVAAAAALALGAAIGGGVPGMITGPPVALVLYLLLLGYFRSQMLSDTRGVTLRTLRDLRDARGKAGVMRA